MSKIAVTAASGKLGAAIASATAALVGHEQVVGLARTPHNARGLGIDVRPGDYNEPDTLESSLNGIDALVLVSGMDAPEKRVGQHRNVIEAAQSAGVQRIVYTSIQGAETGNGFSPVVKSNRQTETDIRASGLEWVIGRNGIYIEPDIEYMDTYKQLGEIVNCAGDGKCGYATREELGVAYANMLTNPKHVGNTYNLHGEAITQSQLADYLNGAFGTQLRFRNVSVEAYQQERIEALGEFLGTVIAGIYEGIRQGALDNESDFALAAGRNHQSWPDYFAELSTS